MTSVGRRTLRVIHATLFSVSAVLGAAFTFLGADYLVPNSSVRSLTFRMTLLIGGILAIAWWGTRGRLRTSLRERQVQQKTAYRLKYVGPAAFGFLLGLGWWTFVPSPLFWLALSVTSQAGLGMLAALAFGLGRSWTAWYGALGSESATAPEHVLKVFFLRSRPALFQLNLLLGFSFIAATLWSSRHSI